VTFEARVTSTSTSSAATGTTRTTRTWVPEPTLVRARGSVLAPLRPGTHFPPVQAGPRVDRPEDPRPASCPAAPGPRLRPPA
jgi:hypothetical protein